MLENLTQEALAANLNTPFHLTHLQWGEVTLELVDVSEKRTTPRQEMYSILFRGPLEQPVEQGMYTFRHEQLGEFPLFIVPLDRRSDGYRYEAVFNHLVK